MAGNTFGTLYRLTSFGESHGAAVGGVIDGCPAGFTINLEELQYELSRRRPGQSAITTQRQEEDKLELLSGIFEGQTTGTPIGFLIRNKDQRSKDYSNLKDIYRPSHADYSYHQKYGVRDYRGGGRSSARETIARVVAGALARQVLAAQGMKINAYTSQVETVSLKKTYAELDLSQTDSNIIRCPDQETARLMIARVEEARKLGDSLGGTITCVIENVPPGLGDPVFEKLHANLGKAMLSINAVKGFDYGSGFAGTLMKGSTHNDSFFVDDKHNVKTRSNHSGGIQGGISNGQTIYFRVAFKPVATIMQKQETITKSQQSTTIDPGGRHDPCVLPRAVPIVETMAAMVIIDHWLLQRAYADF